MRIIRILLIVLSIFLLANGRSCALTAKEQALIHELTRQGASLSYVDAWTTHFCKVNAIRYAAGQE